jgi:4-amino-4-deoxy-L-arabinose transferase-like glycosyltransferase
MRRGCYTVRRTTCEAAARDRHMSLPVPPLAERPPAPRDLPAPRAVHVGLWAGVLAFTAAGLFLPDLMVGDAPQDAVMAMRMHLEDDWTHLIRNGSPYLDKPHLLFWSALSAYRLLGVHDWAYRLPSVLVSLLGAWSVFRLGRRLHGAEAGRIAALVYATSYAIVLANHDVRMDALLTGFCAFALWQLVAWLEDGRRGALLLGAIGLGLAFSAKGLVAVAVVGACLLPHAIATGRTRRLVSPDALLGLAAFALAILPVVLAFHAQYGGRGVRFILLGQGIERFTGGKGTTRGGGDPLFFFHTLLWAVLPWTPLLLAGWGARIARLRRGGWRAFRDEEQVSFVGPIALLLVLGLSRFKLPHYLNPLVPALAVHVGGHLVRTARDAPGALRALARVQAAVVALLLALVAVLGGWVFPLREAWVIVAALAGLAALVAALRGRDPLQRAWVPSAVAAVLVNLVLNAHFFPALSRYQPGSEFTRSALALGIGRGRTYFVDRIYQPFQLYARQLVPVVSVDALRAEAEKGGEVYALVGDEGRARLEAAGLPARVLLSSPDCRITVLSRRLLDPRTRETACGRAWLVAVGVGSATRP